MNPSPAAEKAASIDRQIASLEAELKRIRHNRIDSIFPDAGPLRRELYPKHMEFIAAGATYRERSFISSNRSGKTLLAAYETSCHLTGRYPDWWNGRRFTAPIEVWACGTTNQTTRDIVQANLLGAPGEDGTGMIRAADIVSTVNRAGIPGAVDTAFIQHISGGRSRLGLKSFEQGRKSFEGTGKSVIWVDEEPPLDVYIECLIRLATTKGIMLATFTPLQGWSDVVKAFLEPDSAAAEISAKGPVTVQPAKRWWIQVGWDDCPHLDAATKKELLASIPPYQRDARTKGTPSLGSGAIYPVAESDITVEPFEIPKHWPRAFAMDVGWNRTAVVWGARDPEDGCIYIYSEHYAGSQQPPMHAEAVRARGEWIPGVIDPASNGRSQIDGQQLMTTYRQLGLKLSPADNSVETGIYEVWTLFTSGRLKIFSSCSSLFAELRKYRRDERGRIVKADDHLCFGAGTMIRTPDGTAAIESLRAGDLVSTPLGSARVLGTASHEALTIAWNGTRVTPDHPVWTLASGWIRAGFLQPYDAVCTAGPKTPAAACGHQEANRMAATIGIGAEMCIPAPLPDISLVTAVVYPIATEHGCYFANDVLVSNCDSVRYLIMSGRNRMIPLPAPKRVIRETAPSGERGWMA